MRFSSCWYWLQNPIIFGAERCLDYSRSDCHRQPLLLISLHHHLPSQPPPLLPRCCHLHAAPLRLVVTAMFSRNHFLHSSSSHRWGVPLLLSLLCLTTLIVIRFFWALSSDQITLSAFLLSLALYIIAAFLQKVLITLLTFAVEGTRERVGARHVWDISCKLHHWHFVLWQFDNEKVLCVVFKLWAHLGSVQTWCE